MKPVSAGIVGLVERTARSKDRMEMLVQACYSGSAGPVADKLYAEAFRDGVLYLVATDESWLREGENLADELKDRLNGALGRTFVKRLQIRLQPKASITVGRPIEEHPRESPPAKEVLEAAEAIRDERVRAAFLRLAAGLAARRGLEGGK
jgi:hypothetical protein